ncbi:YihA family ribosome biogenesis GTP-binding protein [Flavipsychrobacter stenotrophus]|uniref:Probable GTP-binding protein EngB n=1 Tax=Flavipsychrobacter stenotrophus TaxID=2077091 RepID=A0A2S7SPW1_9BACT|nr:ribosome biogenesis GTP-binding protein YihA/YsxC [Flavipsychrobacter stenotrophus]PQJ08939.1 YihA family ribosome biogenesis GTP-binding protein [Flavipsychrobacter stenotrophus]
MEITTAKYLISNIDVKACPKPDKPEYAFIGRSNVGKSSLINMLTRNAKLAKTSGSPGKTQLINHFLINNAFYIVDLPGYGFAKRSKVQREEWEKMIDAYLKERTNLVTVFVLVDSRHSPQNLDLAFLRKLGEWGVPFNIAFTKADKITQREAAKNKSLFVNAMKKEWEYIPRTFMTSAEKFHGRNDMLGYIGELNEEWVMPEPDAKPNMEMPL